jgi:hypothetical protein
MSLGPVEYALIEFPGSTFSGEIAPELQKLVEAGTIRVIDLIFITKDEQGDILSLELTGLDADEAAPFERAGVELGNLLTEDDVEIAGEALAPGSSAALIVWEDTWATAFAAGVRNADGRLVAHERIAPDVIEAALAAAAATA